MDQEMTTAAKDALLIALVAQYTREIGNTRSSEILATRNFPILILAVDEIPLISAWNYLLHCGIIKSLERVGGLWFPRGNRD